MTSPVRLSNCFNYCS